MKIILGIGNFGDLYEDTRHNSGFQAVDLLSEDLGIKVNKHDFKSLVGKGKAFDDDILLMKPLTYVNLSGDALIQAKNFYKVDISDIYVLVDDMDTEPGHIRLKLKGSSAGHNGLKSIIANLNTDQFKRNRETGSWFHTGFCSFGTKRQRGLSGLERRNFQGGGSDGIYPSIRFREGNESIQQITCHNLENVLFFLTY